MACFSVAYLAGSKHVKSLAVNQSPLFQVDRVFY